MGSFAANAHLALVRRLWEMDPHEHWNLGSRITRIQGRLDLDLFLSSLPVNEFALTPLSLQASMAIEPSLGEPSGIYVNLRCPVLPVL